MERNLLQLCTIFDTFLPILAKFNNYIFPSDMSGASEEKRI